jgi:hypothetical protein
MESMMENFEKIHSACQKRAEERDRLARRFVLRDLKRAGYGIEWARGREWGYIHGLARRPYLLDVQPVPEAVFRRVQKFGLGAAIDLEIALQRRLASARTERALFVAENKNSQELYVEKVCFDGEIIRQAECQGAAGNFDDGCLRCSFWRDCKEGGTA